MELEKLTAGWEMSNVHDQEGTGNRNIGKNSLQFCGRYRRLREENTPLLFTPALNIHRIPHTQNTKKTSHYYFNPRNLQLPFRHALLATVRILNLIPVTYGEQKA